MGTIAGRRKRRRRRRRQRSDTRVDVNHSKFTVNSQSCGLLPAQELVNIARSEGQSGCEGPFSDAYQERVVDEACWEAKVEVWVVLL